MPAELPAGQVCDLLLVALELVWGRRSRWSCTAQQEPGTAGAHWEGKEEHNLQGSELGAAVCTAQQGLIHGAGPSRKAGRQESFDNPECDRTPEEKNGVYVGPNVFLDTQEPPPASTGGGTTQSPSCYCFHWKTFLPRLFPLVLGSCQDMFGDVWVSCPHPAHSGCSCGLLSYSELPAEVWDRTGGPTSLLFMFLLRCKCTEYRNEPTSRSWAGKEKSPVPPIAPNSPYATGWGLYRQGNQGKKSKIICSGSLIRRFCTFRRAQKEQRRAPE